MNLNYLMKKIHGTLWCVTQLYKLINLPLIKLANFYIFQHFVSCCFYIFNFFLQKKLFQLVVV